MSAEALGRREGARAEKAEGGGRAKGGEKPPASPAVIEELYRKAAILNSGLFGMMATLEHGDPLYGDEDVFPFWEVSTALLVALRELHTGSRTPPTGTGGGA